MDRTALILAPSGLLTELPFSPRGLDDKILHEITTALGCEVCEPVRLTDALEMWMDEEGMGRQPLNVYATLLARRYGHIQQDYWGTAFLVTSDAHGYPTGLDASQIAAMRSQLLSLPVDPPIHSVS